MWADEDPIVVSLKKAKLGLEAALANSQSDCITLKADLNDARQSAKEALFRVCPSFRSWVGHGGADEVCLSWNPQRQEEELRATKAEESLRKRNELVLQLQVQKSNSDQALVKSEQALKVAQLDNKRLSYGAALLPSPHSRTTERTLTTSRAEVELVASRAALNAPAATKLVEEKATLARQVTSLQAELRRTEVTLELVQSSKPNTVRFPPSLRSRDRLTNNAAVNRGDRKCASGAKE